MKTLMILSMMFLVSCGGSSNNPSGGDGNGNGSGDLPTIIKGSLYAVPEYLRRNYSLGYELNYECENDRCSVSGELMHYLTGYEAVSKVEILRGDFMGNKERMIGVFEMVNGQTFYAVIKDGNRVSITDSVNCTLSVNEKTQAQYDSYNETALFAGTSIEFNVLKSGECDI